MDTNEFQQSLLATSTAYLPITAVRTSEVDTVIEEVLKFGLATTPKIRKTDGRTGRTMVWRVSEGYREYKMFYNDLHPKALQPLEAVSGPNDPAFEDCLVQHTPTIIKPDEEYGDANVEFALQYIEDWKSDASKEGPVFFILRDFHAYPNQSTHLTDWLLRIAERTAGHAWHKQIIITHSTKWDVPAELENYVNKVRLDLPDKNFRVNAVVSIREGIKEDPDHADRYPKALEITDDGAEDIADAGAGLTRIQLENLLCMNLAVDETMTQEYLLRAKAKLVEQAGFKLITPRVTFDEVGGLAPLKTWARRRKNRFMDAAFAYGFRRYPKGMLLTGVPGCGKTLVAMCTAYEWGMNIIAVRAPDLKGSLVGESEEKTQKLLDMAEANGPCIVFVDEAEKLLGSQESTRDGGAHDAVLAQFLSFMQDNEAGVYFIFTANQMNKFPPELIDRFEGRWFVDLPSDEERDNICRIHLKLNASEANGLTDILNDEKALSSLVKMTDGYSGRNIEQAIEEAMDIAFDDGRRKVSTDDFKVVLSEMKPTSETKKAEIEAMREFVANGTMRKANTPTVDETESGFVAHRGFA